MRNQFGEFLRKLRKERGLTLIQLQNTSGVSNSYLSQVENGQFQPSPEVLKKLSTALNISQIELMAKAGHINNEKIDWSNHDESNSEKITKVGLFESNLEAFKKGIPIPLFVDGENNVNIQIYKGEEYLNEKDTEMLHAMIKGFLFNVDFTNRRDDE